MTSILDKLPKAFWVCIGISFLPIGFGIGYVLTKSSGVEYVNSNEGTSITIDTASKIKKASNDTEYANEVLRQKIWAIEETLEFLIINEEYPDPILKAVKEEVEELEPVVKEIDRSNEELQEAVERAEEL